MLDITELNRSLSMRIVAASGASAPTPRSGRAAASALRRSLVNGRPTVTWRVTRACNMNCVNCPSDARARRTGPEMSTAEGKALIRDLAALSVPRLVFAGGEPLLRADLPELLAYARGRGIQPVLQTNGTLLNLKQAAALNSAGLHSASILLEGIGREVDRQRGVRGAFQDSIDGYASCEAAGIPAEIRMPLTRRNAPRLAETLDAIERVQIRRVNFTHMVYAGRGNRPEDDLTHQEKRRAMDIILDRAADFHRRGVNIQMATDENHADGIYFYLRLVRKDPWSATQALRLLQARGAVVQGAGVGQAGIGSTGDVHPDPYWHDHVLGNVRQTPFSEIWTGSSDPLLQGLRHRLPLLSGRCGNCRWKSTCGGNLRVRARQFYGDPWTTDPACYLTNQEIGKKVTEQTLALEYDVHMLGQAA